MYLYNKDDEIVFLVFKEKLASQEVQAGDIIGQDILV